MLCLDRGDRCDDRKYYNAWYRLLKGGVHDLGVSCDLFEIGNCYRELVFVYKPGRVVRR